MNPARAYAAGREARCAGYIASDCPHDDWRLAVAWVSGWQHIELAELVDPPSDSLRWQAREIAAEIWPESERG